MTNGNSAATLTAPPASGVAITTRQRNVIFAALMLVLLLASLDQTIVATALPTIVGELGGLAHLSWVVTAYLLTATVSTPIYGKLGDLFGRKRMLQAAIVVFLIASGLCGLSQNMGELIVFRGLQGLGAGGLMVLTFASVGDLVSIRERGRYQGLFGGMFGLATIIGPLLGGFFVENLSWRWIFYINLPIGIVAFVIIGVVLHTRSRTSHPVIDYWGAALLTAALGAIVLFTSLGGTTYAWTSPAILGLMAIAVVTTGAFVVVESGATEPIVPLPLFENRNFTVAGLIGFVVGVALFGAVTFLPLYLQIVKGIAPTQAGLLLTPMMAGVLVASVTSGRIISITGRYRFFPIASTAVLTIGLGLLSMLAVDTPVTLVALELVAMGVGLGMGMQVLVLVAQNSVDYRYLGVATSTSTLFRSVGGSIGLAVFGNIFATELGDQIATHLPAGAALPAGGIDPQALDALPEGFRQQLLPAFTAALHPVFLLAAVIAAIGFVLTWFLKEIPLRQTAAAEGLGESFAMPRSATSLEELERIVGRLIDKENRWRVYTDIAQRAGLALSAPELWLLVRIGETSSADRPVDLASFHEADIATLQKINARLAAGGFTYIPAPTRSGVTAFGRAALERIEDARQRSLSEVLANWHPEKHAEVRAVMRRFAEAVTAEMPHPGPATAAE